MYLVTWASLYANVALVYLRSQRKSTPEAAFWATLGALLLFTINAGPRTILCGYILLSLLLVAIDLFEERRSKVILAVPALFAIWVNTHGTWLIGLVLLVMYILPGWFTIHIGSVDQERRSNTDQKTLILVLAASVAALFLNPYGWHLVWNPFDMIFNQKLNISTIEEWRPLNLEWFIGKDSVAIIGITLIAGMLRARKWKFYEFLFIFFSWYAAFDHIRFAFLAGVVVCPFLAMDLSRLIWKGKKSVREFYLMNVLFAVGALCFMVYMIPSAKRDTQAMNDAWPDSLIKTVQPSWRTFNQYEMGGRFAFDGRKDFVDSRVDTFEHAGVYGDYIKAIMIKDPFAVLNKYRINHILFRQKTPFTYLVEHSPQWDVVKRERSWVLLARKTQS